MSVSEDYSPRRVRATLTVLVICWLLQSALALAQTTLRGMVYDPSGRVVEGATVDVKDAITGTTIATRKTSILGLCSFSLPSGRYLLTVTFEEFRQESVPIFIPPGRMQAFTVQLNMVAAESITVSGDRPSIVLTTVREETGGLTTTFSRDMIDSLPLTNGRTLQSLSSLVLGIAYTESVGTLAQFTGLGQRRFANRLTIDGMSADLAVDVRGPGIGEAASGALPAVATLGGTQTLVPLDAIEDIQIRTANASPEHARAPGAMISIVTRSGGDRLSGSAFSDFRPNRFAARDWFVKAGKAPERENRFWDSGASVGGPVLPRRLFYFASWERQQIERPVDTEVAVPSMALRNAVSDDVRRILDAFPEPNQPNLKDPGSALDLYAGTFPVTSTLSTANVRVDAALSTHHRMFGRVNVGRSTGDELNPELRVPRLSFVHTESTSTQTATAGLLSQRGFLAHELRVNGLWHRGGLTGSVAPYGEAQSLPLAGLADPGVSDAWISLQIGTDHDNASVMSGRTAASRQRQIQFMDTLSISRGRHEWKAGVDYRHILSATDAAPDQYSYRTADINQLMQGHLQALLVHQEAAEARRQAWSLFAQDAFHVTPRLSLDYGVRYRVAPAPESSSPPPLLYEYETLPRRPEDGEPRKLPLGTQLWETSWANIGPQAVATYQLGSRAGRETTIRAGWSLVFDELTSPGAIAFGQTSSSRTTRSFMTKEFPLKEGDFNVPVGSSGAKDYAFPRDLKNPRTQQWQVGVEQALGGAQRLSATYVGAAGRDLIFWSARAATQRRQINTFTNEASSSYKALLLEFVRRPSHGVSGRVTYALSHSVDTDSGESLTALPPDDIVPLELGRGDSDYDRRHLLTALGSYRIPTLGPLLLQRICADWQIDVVAIAQSGGPISLVALRNFGPGVSYWLPPDVVPGVPVWLSDATSPGGKRLNPDAFRLDTPELQSVGRNTIKSFPIRQVDLSLSRAMPLGRSVATIRADVLNIFNLSNFGPPYRWYEPMAGDPNSSFGRSILTYAEALGAGTLTQGGLTPLQQVGGPRAIQLGLRLAF